MAIDRSQSQNFPDGLAYSNCAAGRIGLQVQKRTRE
jgi:hypothetical protein